MWGCGCGAWFFSSAFLRDFSLWLDQSSSDGASYTWCSPAMYNYAWFMVSSHEHTQTIWWMLCSPPSTLNNFRADVVDHSAMMPAPAAHDINGSFFPPTHWNFGHPFVLGLESEPKLWLIYSPENRTIQNQNLKCTDFKWVPNLDVWHTSPNCIWIPKIFNFIPLQAKRVGK